MRWDRTRVRFARRSVVAVVVEDSLGPLDRLCFGHWAAAVWVAVVGSAVVRGAEVVLVAGGMALSGSRKTAALSFWWAWVCEAVFGWAVAGVSGPKAVLEVSSTSEWTFRL